MSAPTRDQIAAAHDDNADLFDFDPEKVEHAVYIVYPNQEPRLLRTDKNILERRAAVHRQNGADVHVVTRKRLVTYTAWEVTT